MQPPPEDDAPIDRLRSIMATLRGPEGCPWDREQTLASLKRYAVEEVYEVIEAIDSGDPTAHCEELGDLLLQVVFQSQLQDEAGSFSFDDVATAICDKLIRRHPHVFGDVVADDPETVLRNWEAIKREEKGGGEVPDSRMDKLPQALPALMVAREAQSRAAKDGFDWPETEGAFDKLREEVSELQAALAESDPEAVSEELGDILFSVVNLARHVSVEPEVALHSATRKFAHRYQIMEGYARAAGTTMQECSLARLESWWQRSKTEPT